MVDEGCDPLHLGQCTLDVGEVVAVLQLSPLCSGGIHCILGVVLALQLGKSLAEEVLAFLKVVHQALSGVLVVKQGLLCIVLSLINHLEDFRLLDHAPLGLRVLTGGALEGEALGVQLGPVDIDDLVVVCNLNLSRGIIERYAVIPAVEVVLMLVPHR